jgi:uncharacterized protein (DUF302 family)
MNAKRGEQFEDYVILGACNPALTQAALDGDRSIALLLPCNVIVRAAGPGRTVVEFVEPALLADVTGLDAMAPIAKQAAALLAAVRAALPS